MGLLTPIAVRIGSIPWMPRLLPQIVWVDKHLQQATRGRLSVLDVAGLPNLLLTVPGRKSGVPRSTPLLCVPHQDGWLVAGSYFGGPTTPMWVHNLRAAGGGEIEWDGEAIAVSSDELEGEERDRAWAAMLDVWPNYALYEQRTERLIPVFVLRRRRQAP